MVEPVDGSGEKKKMKKTPYELWTGKKLQIVHMKVWGCECWIHVPLERDADKLNPRSVEGVFIGYTEDPSQYLVWVPERKEVIKATNPIFIEDGDQRRMPVLRISEPAELGGAQRGGAQQVEIPPLDGGHAVDNEDATEDSSDEDDENPNPVDRATIQASVREENDDGKLGPTTRS